ncbi:unnamed protein product, partial [Ectocarpus sp. 4 AP-2014]
WVQRHFFELEHRTSSKRPNHVIGQECSLETKKLGFSSFYSPDLPGAIPPKTLTPFTKTRKPIPNPQSRSETSYSYQDERTPVQTTSTTVLPPFSPRAHPLVRLYHGQRHPRRTVRHRSKGWLHHARRISVRKVIP